MVLLFSGASPPRHRPQRFQPRKGGISVTDYHAKYFAHDLTRRATVGAERLSQSLFDAAVDLNPHQIEAALFALGSPLSQGVILADEVGLGKTVVAGIVLCQFWAEGKRRLLVLRPASYVNGGNNLENLKTPDQT